MSRKERKVRVILASVEKDPEEPRLKGIELKVVPLDNDELMVPLFLRQKDLNGGRELPKDKEEKELQTVADLLNGFRILSGVKVPIDGWVPKIITIKAE